MKKVLLDTTLIVHLYRKRKEADKIIEHFKGHEFFISVVTYTEFVASAKTKYKKDAKKFLQPYKVLALNETVTKTIITQSYINEVPTTQTADFFIACTAIAHKATLITNNEKHFKYKGLKTHFYSIAWI